MFVSQWCKVYGTEPYLCLNMGTGSLAEALSWVEYCVSQDLYPTSLRRSNPLQNGKADTTWANLRRKNGHEEPYNVKYWAIGNECWVSLCITYKALLSAHARHKGPWQVGQVSAEDCASRSSIFQLG